MPLRRIDHGTWLRVAMVLMLVVMLVGLGLFNIGELKQAVDREENSRRLLSKIDALRSTTSQLELGQRSYLFTGADVALDSYNDAMSRIDGELDALDQFAAASPTLISHMHAVREQIATCKEDLDALVALQKEKGPAEAAAVLRGRVGGNAIADLRRELASMARSVESQVESRSEIVERNYQLARVGQVAGGLLAVVVLGTLVIILGRTLIREREEAERQESNSRRMERVASVSTTVHSANTETSVVGVLEEESRRILGAASAKVVMGAELPSDHAGSIALPIRHREGRVMGHLMLIPRPGQLFDAIDRAIVRQLANMATVAFDNSRLYEELREGGRRKDEFLATLSHELRNPLAPISNALQIIDRDERDADSVKRCHGIISRQLNQLTRLVGDLMDISRISRGKLWLRRRVVDLGDVIHSAIEAGQPAIDARKHTLRTILPPNPTPVYVDAERISQAVLNLLHNAARYTNPGGHIDVEVGVDADRDEIRIVVRDDGIGMSPDSRVRIFDLFTQASRPEGVSAGGLGVGLALVRQLIEMHHGSVNVSSDGPGHGSEFVAVLPAGMAEWSRAAAGDTSGEEVAPLPAQTLKIIVADDNHDAADTLTDLLQLDGHDVTTVYDGEAAVEQVLARSPDLVFLDIGLPGMSGYDAARAIRRQFAGGRLLLIALTGWGQEEDRRRSIEAGFDRHLVKPLDPDTLTEVLFWVMAQQRALGHQRPDPQ